MSAKKQIEEIMNNFDFARVHSVMKFLDWTWVSVGVPSIPALKKEAQRLLIDLAEDSGIRAKECGGFRASIRRTPDGNFLKLDFIIESWDAE